MTQVKICGLRTADDFLAAARAGADFCGMVFVPGRRRQVSFPEARDAVRDFRKQWPHGGRPILVGLFADQPVDEVKEYLFDIGLDAAQLCGNETIAYCRAVTYPVFKVLHVDDSLEFDATVRDFDYRLTMMRENRIHAILDRYDRSQQGGTGKTFNWDVATRLAEKHRFLLAGGLTPDNVGSAVTQVHPWGVDVSSGVETKGIKDHDKIAAFAGAVQHTDADLTRNGYVPPRLVTTSKVLGEPLLPSRYAPAANPVAKDARV